MKAEEEVGSAEGVIDTLFNSAARCADVVSPHGVLTSIAAQCLSLACCRRVLDYQTRAIEMTHDEASIYSSDGQNEDLVFVSVCEV
jgi:hypothetical protein